MGRRLDAQNHESRAYPHGLTHLSSRLSDSWRLPARLPGPASSPTHAMESSPRGGTGRGHGFRAFAAAALAFAALTGFSATAQAQNNPATGRPVITGTAQVGQELFASPGNVVDVDGTSNVSPSYQWIRVDSTTETDITGATTTTYTPVTDDVGKQLKVRLSFTDDLGNPESLTSRATGTVMAATATRQQPTLTIDVDPNRFSEDAGTVIICVVPSAVSSQRITVHAATALQPVFFRPADQPPVDLLPARVSNLAEVLLKSGFPGGESIGKSAKGTKALRVGPMKGQLLVGERVHLFDDGTTQHLLGR